MKLGQIREIIGNIDERSPFKMCKKNFAMLDILEITLKDTIGVECVTLHAVEKDSENTSIKGQADSITYLNKSFEDVMLSFAFSEEHEILCLEMTLYITESWNPFQELDKFSLECREYHSYIDEYSAASYGRVKGVIIFGRITLPVVIAHLPRQEQYDLRYYTEKKDYGEFRLEEIFELLGIKDFLCIMPEGLVSLIRGLSVCELYICCDSKKQAVVSLDIGILIEHEGGWKVMDDLAVNDLKLKLAVEYEGRETEGSGLEIRIMGDFRFHDTSLPVCTWLSSGDTAWFVSVGGGFAVKLGSLADIVQFIGPASITDLLPPGYQWGELYLSHMTLVLSADSFSVAAFSVSVSMKNVWNILDFFCIEKFALEYSLLQEEEGLHHLAQMSGEFRLAGIVFGVYVSKDSQSGWYMRAEGPDHSQISLTDLIQAVAGGPPGLSLPEIELSDLRIEYHAGEDRFFLYALAKASVKKTEFLSFESLWASIRIECQKREDKWDFQCQMDGEVRMLSSEFTVAYTLKDRINLLSFQWKKEDALCLTDFCRWLGFADFYLPEGIDLTLKSLKAELNLSDKQFLLTASSEDEGRIFIKSMLQREKREYIFALLIGMELSLQDLPGVGSVIGSTVRAGIHNLKVLGVSCDMENLTIEGIVDGLNIKKGIYLESELFLRDNVMPLNLPVPLGKEETGYAEEETRLILPVHKSIGAVELRQIQVSYREGSILFGLSAALQANAFYFELDGLAAGYQIKEKTPVFGLDGLSVDVNTGALNINGSFLKKDKHTYAGSLLVKMAGVGITAVGAYTDMPMQSFFVFALLRANLGGPPCFMVTGLAAGFGYNRELKIPEIEKVDNYPLLRAAKGEISGEDIFRKEKEYFKPMQGSHWFAAGILFNSYKMIDSAAILTVLFGKETEINLLGQSVLDVPADGKDPVAHAVLLLKVAFRPASFLVSAEAVLSNDSYVLSKDCHITGGFAFYMWYGGEYAGDFVISLGGYHSRYEKPSHYPNVKRLGLSWKYSSVLSVEGSLYFALTPSCIMTGGNLSILFATGVVEAWFIAAVDILIQWKPYHYLFDINISIGVKVDLRLFAIRLELGCDAHLWGPEFSGIVHVKLWCISFSIPFGDSSECADTVICREEFIDSFLPASGSTEQETGMAFSCCSVDAKGGLIKEYGRETGTEAGEKVWILNPLEFKISVNSVLPASSIDLSVNGNTRNLFTDRAVLGIRPCGKASLHSSLQIRLTRRDQQEIADRFIFTEVIQNVPAALWASSDSYEKKSKAETIPALTGVEIAAMPADYYQFEYTADYNTGVKSLSIPKLPKLPSQKSDQSKAYEYIARIESPEVAKARAELLRGLPPGYQEIQVSGLAKDPGGFFISKPVIVSIGGEE